MTKNEILRRYPNASPAFIKANLDPEDTGKGSKLECGVSDEPLATPKDEKRNTKPVLICIVSVRKRLLDSDNIASKWHTDCLRFIGAIHGDEPEKATIQTTQRKVKEGESEHTEISIFELP